MGMGSYIGYFSRSFLLVCSCDRRGTTLAWYTTAFRGFGPWSWTHVWWTKYGCQTCSLPTKKVLPSI